MDLCLALTSHSYESHRYPYDFINNWDYSVLDATTGQNLEHCQLRHHPAYREVWSRSYSNELGRLYQGVGTNPTNTGKHVKGNNTFKVIRYENIPHDRRKEITYSKVVFPVRPEKSDPNRTHITIGSNRI